MTETETTESSTTRELAPHDPKRGLCPRSSDPSAPCTCDLRSRRHVRQCNRTSYDWMPCTCVIHEVMSR